MALISRCRDARGAKQTLERALIAVVEAHIQVAAYPDDEGDVVFDKEFKPLVANELCVAQQQLDRPLAEQRHEAGQQRHALRHARAAAIVQNVPHHRNAHTLRGDAQDQQVDVLASNLPVGAVQAQPIRRLKPQ